MITNPTFSPTKHVFSAFATQKKTHHIALYTQRKKMTSLARLSSFRLIGATSSSVFHPPSLAPISATRTFFSSPLNNNSSNNKLTSAADRIKKGTAVLIDVREKGEWLSDGVAEPAFLLSLSSLQSGSPQWNEFLSQNKDKELLIYCKLGGRAGSVADFLKSQGFKTENLGGFGEWAGAGLPVRKPKAEEMK